MDRPSIFVVMGVSGCGKSTLGAALALALNIPFIEGDDLHPQANIDKMTRGVALEDGDRQSWLEALRLIIEKHLSLKQSFVVSCSALKRRYRDILGREPAIMYLCLETQADILESRIKARADHFMPASLMASQLKALELPERDERALVLNASKPTTALIKEVLIQAEWQACERAL